MSRCLRSLIGQLSLLLVPNMVLSKMNNHEHRTKQTYESYTFQPLISFCSDPVELQTIVSCLMNNVCEEEPISMFWAPNELNDLKEERFEFPFILIGTSTMEFLIGQSWRVVKSWYTGGGPEH